MNVQQDRHAGVLVHISSLPGPHGIGDLGKEARSMAETIRAAGFDYWQILPLGPTGYGNSPYAARSTFAGNELFIDLRTLVEWDLLTSEEIASISESAVDRVDYSAVYANKMPLLKVAAERCLTLGEDFALASDFKTFCDDEAYWLADYALFMCLYELYQDARWFSHWPQEFADRDSSALDALRERHRLEIAQWYVLQFFFHVQWMNLRAHVNALGLHIIGDLPIFVAADSVDTWSNRDLFKTDSQGSFSAVSGVPPDFFSSTGQLWGNPVYDWDTRKEALYEWWIRRFSRTLQCVDIVRVDHFRGFDAYWEIPAGSTTAESGRWVDVPGKDLFATIRTHLGTIPIIAEDLGVVTPSVEQLRDSNGFPGMKLYQYGFTFDDFGRLNGLDEFLPHNYPYQCVAYTGTHDNDTTLGWFLSIPSSLQYIVCRYLACSADTVVESMIRTLIASHARTVIIPLQDILNLDSSARMNTPSTCGNHNWSWRVSPSLMQKFPADSLSELLHLYGRSANRTYAQEHILTE